MVDIPKAIIPNALDIPKVQLKVPTARIPKYAPMVIPPTDLEQPEGVTASTSDKTEQPVVRKLDIPIIDIEMPLPSPEVLVTAVTTAVVAVATTSVTSSLFEPIKKKVQKQLQKQVDKWKEKRKKKEVCSAN